MEHLHLGSPHPRIGRIRRATAKRRLLDAISRAHAARMHRRQPCGTHARTGRIPFDVRARTRADLPRNPLRRRMPARARAAANPPCRMRGHRNRHRPGRAHLVVDLPVRTHRDRHRGNRRPRLLRSDARLRARRAEPPCRRVRRDRGGFAAGLGRAAALVEACA